MLTFLRSHWMVITICLVYTLLATGAAYYFASSSAHKNKAALLKGAEELKTTKEALDKSSLDAAKNKLALDKERALNANLKKMLTAAEQERESLRSSLETMTAAASKPAKAQPSAAKAPPPAVSTACRDKTAAAEKDLKNQQIALQAFKADVYKRDNELRERQKQLDETLAKIAEERRKLERDRADYRWPHNGAQSGK